ncbi:MAG TPA: hypothetical protein VFR23_04090, partial [Jiangellaceae bacterium]|nr:hypothetical protein [Jiangellaceae bacterium]
DRESSWCKRANPVMPGYPWYPGWWSDEQMDQRLATGAQVLRVGGDYEHEREVERKPVPSGVGGYSYGNHVLLLPDALPDAVMGSS